MDRWRIKSKPKPKRAPFLLQTSLDQYHFTSRLRSEVSPIEQLPAELLMQILVLLPFCSATVRKHIHPQKLPEPQKPDGDGDDADDERFVPIEACAAERRRAEGCYKYCTGKKPWNWLVVLRVCKTWYAAAYATPSFWERVPLQSPITTLRTLRGRAGGASFPLFVDVRPWRKAYSVSMIKRATRTALLFLPRIVDLFLTADISDSDDLYILCNNVAPRLQSLTILGPDDNLGHSDLPLSLFNHQTPARLTTLRLESCCIPLSHPLYSSQLTSLNLTWCLNAFNSIDHFLSVFSSLTSLRHLLLSGPLTLPSDFDRDGGVANANANAKPPYLPKLQPIKLELPLSHLVNVLDFLRFPSTVCLDLGIMYDFDDALVPSFSHRLVDVLTRHFAPARKAREMYTKIDVFVSEDTDEDGYKVEASFYSPTSTQHLPRRVDIWHSWPGPANTADVEGVAHRLVQTVPFATRADPGSDTDGLWLNFTQLSTPNPLPNVPPHSTWWRAFEHARLQRLTLFESDAIDSGLAWLSTSMGTDLGTSTDADGGGGGRSFLYPDLDVLAFVYGFFRLESRAELVERHLEWRARSNEAKYQVWLMQCQMSTSWAKGLRQLFGKDMVRVSKRYKYHVRPCFSAEIAEGE